MKILITGIGNIGKSSLREMVANKFVGQVIDIDMDYYTQADIPQTSNKVLLIEDVHGLERNFDQYDKIIYLMPPQNHTMLWLKRAWAWFSSGIVDRPDPKGICKPYAFYNIPIILKIVLKNIIFRKKWVSDDIQIIKKNVENKTIIVRSVDMGYMEIEKNFY